jgi:hypothetical protein
MPDRNHPIEATMRMSTSLRRSLTAAVLATLALLLPLKPAQAAEYSDLWVTAGENAWGVNFVQWDSIIYATMYIYGPDKKPTWYGAVLNRDVSGNFAGTLYSHIGTYFASSWKDSDHVESVAGTATFRPSTTNNYEGTLVYTVNGVGTVTKPLQRYSDHPAVPLAGNYYGGESGGYTGCTSISDNIIFVDSFPLTVTQTASTLTLVFAYEGLKETCTLAGNVVQNGLLYSVPTATYACTDGLGTTAAITDIKQTAQGIEGSFTAPVPGGCLETTRFSAVRN